MPHISNDQLADIAESIEFQREQLKLCYQVLSKAHENLSSGTDSELWIFIVGMVSAFLTNCEDELSGEVMNLKKLTRTP